ncbi:hypothetical protein EV1_015363 [Malus domestica]
MLVSRCAVQFSLGTFFKHLPVSNPATLCPYRFRPKTLTAPAIRSSSYFETLDSRQKEQVHLYVDTLLQWNQKMNLPAVKEADEVMERHIEDSLAIIPPVRNSYLSRLLEIPGLILAIACPGWEVTLMESMNKRCIFLEHVVGHIGLSNVQVVRGRAEEEVRNAEKAIQILVESHSPYRQRTTIVCLKTFPTPWKYPRDPGTPEKIPL